MLLYEVKRLSGVNWHDVGISDVWATGCRPRASLFLAFLINTRQNDRMIFSAPWARHAMTVTEYRVNDACDGQNYKF